MKIKFMCIITSILIIFTGCNSKTPDADSKKDKSFLSLSPAMVMTEDSDGSLEINELAKGKVGNRIGKIENIIDFKYSNVSNVYCTLNLLERGTSINKNKLTVFYKGNESKLDDIYSVSDFKMSSDGEYILYRGYLNDNINSMMDLSIYKPNSKETEKIESDIFISGDLYDFIDNKTIIYYGSDNAKKETGIYTYDIENKKEDKIINVDDVYITYIKAISEKDILVLKEGTDYCNLEIINIDSKSQVKIYSHIKSIISCISKNKKIYFSAYNDENSTSIYVYDGNKVKRIMYDFPKNVYTYSSMAADDDGNIYFIGYDDDEYVRNVFLIDKDDSINLISNTEMKYTIYKNTSY